MNATNVFCDKCHTFNCSTHLSLSARLNRLLNHFEEPSDNMITYVEPDKQLGSSKPFDKTYATNTLSPSVYNSPASYDRHDQRIRVDVSESDNSTSSIDRITNDIERKALQNKEQTNTSIVPYNSQQATTSDIVKFTGARYKAHEQYHSTPVNACSFVSCASPDGLYSETVLFIWLNNKYAKYSCDRYRITISLMFDSEEDLWSVSSKLIKRTSYYGKEEEETAISNRLCKIVELRSEIKKMLLFFGLSPRHVYRLFRKNILEDFVIKTNGGFSTVECRSHANLVKEFEKTTVTNTGWDHHRHYRDAHTSRTSSMMKPEEYEKYMEEYGDYPGGHCYGL